MFRDPGSASAEEWDAYAWFGFAISEAQFIERQLLVVAVALDSLKAEAYAEILWSEMYDNLGRLTLGKLLKRVRRHHEVPTELANLLDEAVARRNALAHEFFWPPQVDDGEEPSPADATKRLQADATLFEHVGVRLEPLVWSLLDALHVKRHDIETKAEAISRTDMVKP